jgi:hypothetical protein
VKAYKNIIIFTIVGFFFLNLYPVQFYGTSGSSIHELGFPYTYTQFPQPEPPKDYIYGLSRDFYFKINFEHLVYNSLVMFFIILVFLGFQAYLARLNSN